MIGGLVALLGVAAVGVVGFQMQRHQAGSTAEATPVSAAVDSDARETVQVEKRAESGDDSTDDGGTDLSNLPDAEEQEADVDTAPVVGGPLPTDASDLAGSAPADDKDEKKPTEKPDLPNDGDLGEAVADAAGVDPNAKVKSGEETSVGNTGPAVTPTRPPQGAVSAGVRPGRNAAKACVAGADDVTSVNLTFASSGNATSINVGGWAAANGKAACVKSAFAGVNVGKFQDSSYSVGVSVRP